MTWSHNSRGGYNIKHNAQKKSLTYSEPSTSLSVGMGRLTLSLFPGQLLGFLKVYHVPSMGPFILNPTRWALRGFPQVEGWHS